VAEHFDAGAPSIAGASRGRGSRTSRRSRALSHALGQCPQISAGSASSRGRRRHRRSAREVAEAGDKTRAAIRVRRLARRDLRRYRHLGGGREEKPTNTTRFIVLAREAKWAAKPARAHRHDLPVPGAQTCRPPSTRQNGRLRHQRRHMTKLEATWLRPIHLRHPVYAPDVEGHPEDHQPGAPRLGRGSPSFSRRMKILGSNPAHPFRMTSRKSAGYVGRARSALCAHLRALLRNGVFRLVPADAGTHQT